MPKRNRQEPGVQAAMSFLLSVIEAGQWVGEVGSDQWKRIWAMPWEGWTKPNYDELQAACALVGSNKRLQRILGCEYMKAWYLASRPEILHWVDWRVITEAIGLNNPLRMPERVGKWRSKNVLKCGKMKASKNNETLQIDLLDVPEKKKRKQKPKSKNPATVLQRMLDNHRNNVNADDNEEDEVAEFL